MRPILFDLLIVLIILLSAFLGRRKGFILTLCGFLALFVALIGAGVLTNLLAEPLSRLALPFVEQALTEALQTSADELAAGAEAAVTATIDQVLVLMEQSQLLRGLSDSVAQAVEQGLLDVTVDAAHSVALYAAEQFTRLILFPIFFLLIMLIWTALSHILDLAFHLPGLNFLNRTAGLLLGLARGVLLVFILCWLLKDSYLPQTTIDGSFLLPYFCGSNPLLNISMLNS